MKLRALGAEGRTTSPRQFIAVERYVSRLVVIKRTNDKKVAIREAKKFHEATGRAVAVIDQTVHPTSWAVADHVEFMIERRGE